MCRSSDCVAACSSAILHRDAIARSHRTLRHGEIGDSAATRSLPEMALARRQALLPCLWSDIEGRNVLVVGGTRGTGPLRLICQTRHCHSIPMDWEIPTDEGLTRMSMLPEEESLPRKTTARSWEKFSTRFRKFAMQFRPAA